MKARTIYTPISEKRMLNAPEGAQYSGMGLNSFRKWAEEIGAVRRFGRITRYDKRTIDNALDNSETIEFT